MTKENPADLRHEAAVVVIVELTSTPYDDVVTVPVTQHWRSDGPEQYPENEDPPLEEHNDVCMHDPVPEGVVQEGWVQHLISDEPGHKPEVTEPELQHPAEILTQAPSYPDTVHVAEYEQIPVLTSSLPACIPVASTEALW